MSVEREDRIRERAYYFWQEEGRPEGRDLDHWLRANAEEDAVPAPAPEVQPVVEEEVKAAQVVISHIDYKGTKRTGSDEYIELTNKGTAVADVGGWKINAGAKGQDFVFPEGAQIGIGQSVRVYTNMKDHAFGGYTFGSKRALWNNKGDEGSLFDQQGNLVSSYKYP